MEVDLLVKNLQVFNAYFKKFIPADVAVLNGRFLYISKDWEGQLAPLQVIDGEGQYMIPGLIDIHMHIESSMTTPVNFAKAAIQHGITTVVADPHEIANVFGVEGIEAMIHKVCPDIMDIFFGIPSSVPSTSSWLETTGGCIKEEDVLDLLQEHSVCCLGEVMNFKDLTGDKNSLINRIIDLVKSRKPYMPIEGHCPKIKGLELSRYIYQGVDADHTQQTVSSLEEKIASGMFMEIQQKSLTKENINYLIENNLYEHFCFVTDDVMADKLPQTHLNGLVKKAIAMGMPPEMAVYTATFTPARRMGLKDRGSIAPGRIADFVLIQDIKDFKITSVYKRGKRISIDKYDNSHNKNSFPQHFYKSVKVPLVSSFDFCVSAPISTGDIQCRIIKVQSNTTFTQEEVSAVSVKSSLLQWESSPHCLITVFERYGKTGNKAFGLVSGDVIKEGAVATTYAHDHHNLMVMGKNSEDMALAANWIIENQGGYCVVKDRQIIAALSLPVGGILSEEPVDILAENLKKVRNALRALGYNHNNEIMSFSTLSLPVSPALKITDKGLIRVSTQEIISLFCNS